MRGQKLNPKSKTLLIRKFHDIWIHKHKRTSNIWSQGLKTRADVTEQKKARSLSGSHSSEC